MTVSGLRDRLRPALIALGVLVLLAASLAVAAYNEHQNRLQATQAAQTQAQVLADTVTAALSFSDNGALREYVDALRANPELDAVGVYDSDGRLAAGYTRSDLADRLSNVLTPRGAPDRIIVFAPVVQNGQRLGMVYVRDRIEPITRRLSRYVGPSLLVLMAMMMFAVSTLDALALRRANQDLQTQMVERERAEAALRQSQKMEAIGRLTGGIAHDFNNMLAIIIGSLELLLKRHADADPKLLRFVHHAMEGAKRAAALTQRLLAFSRLQPLNPTPSDITRTVTDMTDLLRRTLGEAVAVETVLVGGLWRAHIDLPQLEIAIINLAINARDAMPEGGKLTIETGNAYLDRTYVQGEEDLQPGQYVMIAITDTGTGIAPELLSQVFEPFFTTKPAGKGTGLGLSQVQGFIKQSGGHLRIYSEVGVGTTVKLYLPRALAAADRPPASMSRSAAPARRETTVLVVEDEAGVRDFAVEALIELGFDTVAADGGRAALDLLDAHPEISVILSDVVMPEMNGRMFVEQALKRRPDLEVVFMTGYTRNAIVHNGVLDPGTHLVTKPFTVAQLGAEIDAVLGVR